MKRLLVIGVLLAAVGMLAGTGSQMSQAADKPVKRAPTKLWKAFPLVDRPEPVVRYGTAGTSITHVSQPPLATGEHAVGFDSNARLTSLLLATALALMLASFALTFTLFGSPLAAFARTSPRDKDSGSRPRRRLSHAGRAVAARRIRREERRASSAAPSPKPAPPPKPTAALTAREDGDPATEAPAGAENADAMKVSRERAGEIETLKAKGDAPARGRLGLRRRDVEALKAKHMDEATAAARPETLKAKLAAEPAVTAVPETTARDDWDWEEHDAATAAEPGAAPSGGDQDDLDRVLADAVSQARVLAPAVATCRVGWVRGYRSSEFELATPAKEKVIATSRPFRWHKRTPPPEGAAAKRALGEVVETAEQNGWTPTGRRGRNWYELEFTRAHTRQIGAVSAASCAIEWSRAYVTARFEAVAYDIDLHPSTIACSPDFRWRKNTPPTESAAASKALHALVRTLEEDGWEPSGRGADWFALQFTNTGRRMTPVATGRRPRRSQE